jgi:hypothetical protein
VVPTAVVWAVLLCSSLHGENGATEAFKFRSRAPADPLYRGQLSAELVRQSPARQPHSATHVCATSLVHSQTPKPNQINVLLLPLGILVDGCPGNANAKRPVSSATQHKHKR